MSPDDRDRGLLESTLAASPQPHSPQPHMASPIQSLRIDEGCIACNLCEDLAPAVFEVPIGGECQVKRGALERVQEDAELRDAVQEAAESCPVEVILVNESGDLS